MLHLFLWSLFFTHLPTAVWGHARLMSPPSRSSMWRFGFPTRKNFNDNALYCGGIHVQWKRNGGKCGICGDAYDMPHPRDNEAGGKFGTGIISKRYVSGQIIEATVQVTTNHLGYFEFKLCPNNNPKQEATQECLDKYVLREAHGTGTRYYIGNRGRGDVTVQLQLPKGLTCTQCVFQWTYVAGNNWGRCSDGASRLGCGPQETFRGCADIAIDDTPDAFNVQFGENDIRSKHFNTPYYKNRKLGLSTDSKLHDLTDASKADKNNVSWVNSVNDKHTSDVQKNPSLKEDSLLPSLELTTSPFPEDPLLSETSGNEKENQNNKQSKADEKSLHETVNKQQGRDESLLSTIFPGESDNNRSPDGKKTYTYRTESLPHFLFSAGNVRSDLEKKNLSRGFSLNGRNYKDIFYL